MSETRWAELLGWDGNDLQDLRFVGYSYIKQGHYETALKFFEALIVLDRNSAYDHQTLGAIYLEMGENNKALKMIDKALLLDPTHEPTLLNRAKALFLLGYTERAKKLAFDLTKAKNSTLAQNADALLLAYR